MIVPHRSAARPRGHLPIVAASCLYATGDADEGIWSAGQVQGLIHDIPSCAELVSRMMREAEAIIQRRLQAMISGNRRQAAE
jgi:nitronate monooxygenase